MNVTGRKLMHLFRTRNTLFVILCFVILGTLIYSNSFKAHFQLDDSYQIIKQEDVKDLSAYGNINKWIRIDKYRPLAKLTLAINYGIHGEKVFGYHLLNLIIHILSSLFVYLLLVELFRSPVFKNERFREHSRLVAFFCALLFLAHPLQTQSVTYIIQRMSSLAGMFYFLSVLSYAKARFSFLDGNRRYLMWLVVAFLSGMAALLSKQNAVTFPVAWLLVELFFVRSKENKPFKKYLIAGFSIIALVSALIILTGNLPRETYKIGRIEYLFTQFRVLLKYLQLSLIPFGQNIDHDIAVSTTYTGLREILSLLANLFLIVLGVLLYKKQRLISFGIFWFFLTISVTSSVIPISDVIFEHRMYVPLLGIMLIIVSLVFQLSAKRSIGFFSRLMLLLFVFYGILSFARNEVWETRYSLWSDAAQKSPNLPRPKQNLGNSALEKGDFQGALKWFNEVIRLDSTYHDAYFNRANIKFHLKDYKGAEKDMERFIVKRPEVVVAYDILGKIKMHLGEHDEAISLFNRLLNKDSTFGLAYINRGKAKMYLNRYRPAISDFLKAAELGVAVADAYNFAGQCYIYIQQAEKALEFFSRAIEANPALARAYFNRGYLLTQRKEIERGLQDFNRAIQLDPKQYLAYKGRGIIFYWKGQYEQAYRDLLTARKAGVDIPEDLMQDVQQKLAAGGEEE